MLVGRIDSDAPSGGLLRPATTDPVTHLDTLEIGGDMDWWGELSDPDGRRIRLCTSRPPVS